MPKPVTDLPDSQVSPAPALEKRTRRRFSPEYKLRIITEAEACKRGELGALLLFPTLFRKAIPRYFRTGQESFSRIIWHRPEEDSAARERFRARELWV